MKLHHFIASKTSEDATRVQEIGKALAPAKPVNEVKLADIKRIEPVKKKTAEVSKDGDLTQQMRDFAVDQLENSTHSAHIHHKIRHYD